MPSSVTIGAALCAALVSACNSGPEVVATQRQTDAPTSDASTLFNQPLATPCEPGQYIGGFSSSADGDAAPIFPLKGDITFELVQQLHGEFPSLADGATLTGHSTVSDVSFSATIRGGKNCENGAFNTTLENGQFTVGGGTPYPFNGTVNGQYYEANHGFIGGWKALLNNTPTTIIGNWSAILDTNRP